MGKYIRFDMLQNEAQGDFHSTQRNSWANNKRKLENDQEPHRYEASSQLAFHQLSKTSTNFLKDDWVDVSESI